MFESLKLLFHRFHYKRNSNYFYKFIYFLIIIISNLPVLADDNEFKVYLINKSWHTGLMFKQNSISSNEIGPLCLFESYEYIDIGWGDADFYMASEFDPKLAAKAILVPTKSVVRIEGYNATIEEIINWSDYTVELTLDSINLTKLCRYIENSFFKDSLGKYVISKTVHEGKIRYFNSGLKYHGLNTCNTWAAKALQYAGFDISTFLIVTSGQLKNAVKKIGKLKKN